MKVDILRGMRKNHYIVYNKQQNNRFFNTKWYTIRKDNSQLVGEFGSIREIIESYLKKRYGVVKYYKVIEDHERNVHIRKGKNILKTASSYQTGINA